MVSKPPERGEAPTLNKFTGIVRIRTSMSAIKSSAPDINSYTGWLHGYEWMYVVKEDRAHLCCLFTLRLDSNEFSCHLFKVPKSENGESCSG